MITVSPLFQLADVTTFAIPAVCDNYVEYDTVEDLRSLGPLLNSGRGVKCIGQGSNMLFTSNYQGTVLHCNDASVTVLGEDARNVRLRVGAGKTLDALAYETASRGWWGLECLSGIPGEAGASAVQNVGAYGAEAADVITSVTAYDFATGDTVEFSASECRFGYRDSIFKHVNIPCTRYAILSVVISLSKAAVPRMGYPALAQAFGGRGPASPMEVRNVVLKIREGKLPEPSVVPSAGSYFKNPVVGERKLHQVATAAGGLEAFPHYRVDGGWKIPAAWLIDQCGWKGSDIGNVSVWHLQPLVITNPHRTATAADVLAAEKAIAGSVKEKFGITLEPEVEHI